MNRDYGILSSFPEMGMRVIMLFIQQRMKSVTSLFTISIVRKLCTLIFHSLQFTNNILPHVTFDLFYNFGLNIHTKSHYSKCLDFVQKLI